MIFRFYDRTNAVKILLNYAGWFFVASAILTFLYFDFLVFKRPSGYMGEFLDKVIDAGFFWFFALPAVIFLSLFTLNSHVARFCQLSIAMIASGLFIGAMTGRYISRGGSESLADGLDALGSGFVLLNIFIILLLFFLSIIMRVVRRKGNPFYPIFYKTCLTICGGWLTGVAIWGYNYPKYVVNSAEKLSSTNHYCIVNGKNVIVSYPSDLMPQNMHFSGDYIYHALLTVSQGGENKKYYWSYGRREFVEIVYNGPSYACEPKVHFARDLSWFRRE